MTEPRMSGQEDEAQEVSGSSGVLLTGPPEAAGTDGRRRR